MPRGEGGVTGLFLRTRGSALLPHLPHTRCPSELPPPQAGGHPPQQARLRAISATTGPTQNSDANRAGPRVCRGGSQPSFPSCGPTQRCSDPRMTLAWPRRGSQPSPEPGRAPATTTARLTPGSRGRGRWDSVCCEWAARPSELHWGRGPSCTSPPSPEGHTAGKSALGSDQGRVGEGGAQIGCPARPRSLATLGSSLSPQPSAAHGPQPGQLLESHWRL